MPIDFDNRAYLWLLAAVAGVGLPLLWWWSYRSLAGLGSVRRIVALCLRSAVIVLLVLALAQMLWVRTSDRLTVLYLLDQSTSIPSEHRRMMADYVNESVVRHRQVDREDRAGVIVFAREAAVEYPPLDDAIRIGPHPETRLDPANTNLAGALRLAAATLPADSAGRVVIVTDGNENIGNALDQARELAERGVGVDVVPIRYAARSEVAVEKLAVPSDVRQGSPFDVRVVLNNAASADGAEAKPAKGRLQVFRKTRDGERQLIDQSVTVDPGKQVFTVREELEAADFYTYTARFLPDDESSDRLSQNNEATGFSHVRGRGQVLLIEDAANRGEFNHLVDALRRENVQVTVLDTDELFTSLGQLQPFDTVVLANVPREAFSSEQIKMLVSNTQQLGSGLVMLGGPNSFGAGGWANTELEAALPVDCQIKNAKVRPVGALGLVIDRSSSMAGDKLGMAKSAAIAANDILSNSDYLTVTTFDSEGYLIVPLVKKGDSTTIKARIDRISSGGGTNMRPGIELAYRELLGATAAAVRHLVVLSDGQTMGENYEQLVQKLRQDKITVSTVAVGQGADSNLLRRLARAGGGRFYHATTPRVLPRIFQEEARVVARPLVFERKPGFQPQVVYPHEMIKGIDGAPPPITGYVLTTKKENPLVEVVLRSPVPSAAEDNRTLLATWNYGLGKSVAFTSDAGRRWASDWPGWAGYDKLFSQVVRWSMRPTGDTGKFTVSAEPRDGKVHVVVNALDQDDGFLNFLAPTGSAVGPDMKPIDLRLRQTAPGRYVGEFDAEAAGSYFVMLMPSAGMAPILTGVDVPYSAEFLDREANEGLLAALAGLTPTGSEPGRLIEDATGRGIEELAKVDVFRHNLPKAASSQDVWPQLLLAASYLFLCDVFVRRVHVNFAWVPALVQKARDRLRGRESVQPVETMARLRSRKDAIGQSLEARRAAVSLAPSDAEVAARRTPEQKSKRFVADADVVAEAVAVHDEPSKPPTGPAPPASPAPASEEAADSYTSRLLKAKREALRDRQK